MALVLLLAIPAVSMFGGALFSFINPEIAARTSNYVRNWHLLNMLKIMVMWGTAAVVYSAKKQEFSRLSEILVQVNLPVGSTRAARYSFVSANSGPQWF